MELPRDAVLERIARANPRIVVAITPPGWGKTFLGTEMLEHARSGVLCAFTGIRSVDEADTRMQAAFGADDPASGDWDLMVLDDVDHLIAAGGSDRLEALLHGLPAGRRLVLFARDALSVDIFRYAAPHEILSLRRNDFELTRDEMKRAFKSEELSREVRERALAIAAGWPISTLLMSRLAREGRLAESLLDLSCDAFVDLHRYVRGHLFARLNEREYAVLMACAAIPHATSEDISAALGFDAEPTLRAMAARRIYYFEAKDDEYVLHPLAEASIRAFDGEQLDAFVRTAARTLIAAGRLMRGARLELLAGDVHAACATLDRSGPHATGETISADYFAIADALPLEEVFASRHVFVDYFGSRLARSRPYELYDRVAKFHETMAPDVSPLVRYSAKIGLFIALRHSSKLREAEVVGQACLALAEQFPDWPDRRTLFMCDYACLVGMLGKIERAARLWSEIHVDAQHEPAFYSLQLVVLQFSAMLYRGENANLVDMLDRNIESSRRWNDAPSLVISLGSRAIADVMIDPGVSLASALRAIQADSAQSRFFYHAQRIVEAEDHHPTVTGCLLTIEAALEQTDTEVATRLLDNALAGFDRIGQPYWRIVARLARAAVPRCDRARLLDECVSLSREIESPLLVTQIAAFVADRDVDGPYSGFLARLAQSALVKGAARLRINVMTASVTRGNVQVPMRSREFEVAAVLAMAGAPVSVERLCEQVWPAADAEAAVSALRMSVHRLRKQLGSPDVVVNVAAGYMLSADVGVDIVDAEGTLSAARRLSTMSEGDYDRLRALFKQLTVNLNMGERYAWHAKIDARIQAVRHGVGALIARYDLARGRALEALETAEALLRFDALDEPAVELAVRALLAAGDRSEAAHRWRLYTRRLEDEYAAQPSAILQSIIDDTLVLA